MSTTELSLSRQPAPEYRVSSPVMTFEQQVKLAEAFAKSGLFGVKTTDQALALMALCEAEGMHPATAVRDYHIIQGKPTMKAEAMLARFLRNGGKVEWHERTDQAADATFTHPFGGKVRVNWTILMAKTAGLVGKDVWKAYPRALLHARCVSEGVRAVDPQSTGHTYTPEEVRDIEVPGGYIDTAAEIVLAREKLSEDYAQRFRDALDSKIPEEEIAQQISMVHEAIKTDPNYVDLYKAIWKHIHSKDRSMIKEYIKMANGDNGSATRTAEPLTAQD